MSFGSNTYTVVEGSSVTVTVKLSSAADQSVTIPLTTMDQGGASSDDYSVVPTEVTFTSGDTEETVTFSATADDEGSEGESVKLGFDTLPSGVAEGSPNETTVSITEPAPPIDTGEPPIDTGVPPIDTGVPPIDTVDPIDTIDPVDPQVTVSFELASYPVEEGESVDVKVKLSEDPQRSVTILITRDNQGGAVDGDYSGVPVDVEFLSGEMEKTIAFLAVDDLDDDDGESVVLGFDTLPDGVARGTQQTTRVNITDDDDPQVTVSFESASYTVEEGKSIAVKVKLDADPEREVRIPIEADSPSGATSNDYSGVPVEVVFVSGDQEESDHLQGPPMTTTTTRARA